jgi:hypothetical protein
LTLWFDGGVVVEEATVKKVEPGHGVAEVE